MKIDRRSFLKALSGAAAGAVVPIGFVDEALALPEPEAIEPSADLLALRDKVREIMARVKPEEMFSLSQSNKIFRKHAQPAVYVKDTNLLPTNVEVPHLTAVTMRYPSHEHQSYSQRFVWTVRHDEVGLGFVIKPDIDEQEILPCLLGLVKTFAVMREKDAAAVFNYADVYDPNLGGDAVALCSLHHPYEDGVWANTFKTQQDLNGSSLVNAMMGIRIGFVDEAGFKIRARGKKLLVPVAKMETAARLLHTGLRPGMYPQDGEVIHPVHGIAGEEHYIVWDYLESERNWFVLTDVDGLIHVERHPFRFDLEIDPRTNTLLIAGYERRGYGYVDPRAVFGSILESSKHRPRQLAA